MTSKKEKYSNRIGQATGATDISYVGNNQYIGATPNQRIYTYVEENPSQAAGAVDYIAQQMYNNNYDRGYLGISFDIENIPEVKAKAEETGIGLLSLDETKEPNVLTPPSSRSDVVFKRLIPKEYQKEIEGLGESDKIKEGLTENFDTIHREQKLKDFPEEIIISVILAGIFGSASWYIIQYYLELYQRDWIVLWAFGICGGILFILIFYYLILRVKRAKDNKKIKS